MTTLDQLNPKSVGKAVQFIKYYELLKSGSTIEEIKSIRIPKPLTIPFEKMKKKIEQLNLNMTTLDQLNPEIRWRDCSILLKYYELLKLESMTEEMRVEPLDYTFESYICNHYH